MTYSDETLRILKEAYKEILFNLGNKLASGIKGEEYKRVLKEYSEFKASPFWKGYLMNREQERGSA